jgi:MFS family permease
MGPALAVRGDLEGASAAMSGLRGILLDLRPLRRHRDFRILLFGQLASGFGRQVTLIALPYQLYVMTRSPLAIGGLALVQLVPLLALSLAGGAMADRIDRRRLLLLTQSSLLVTSALLAIVATLAEPPILLIYIIAFAAASISAIDSPTRTSAIYGMVPREELGWAISIMQAVWQLSQVLGPALGGVLIAVVGLPAAYATDALTFGGSIAALLAIAPIPPTIAATGRTTLAAIREGLAYARRTPAILSTFVVDLDAMIFGLPVALFPILAIDTFHMGAEGVGLMTAAPAAGALLGAVLTGWVNRVRYRGRAVLLAVFVWGLSITLFGLSTFFFPLALVFLAIAGAADMFSAIFRSTILQVSVPDELRGRLSALHLMVVAGGPRVGELEATGVAAIAGAPFSVISGGLLSIVGVALVAWRFPQLAAYDAHAVAREATAALVHLPTTTSRSAEETKVDAIGS